MPKGIGYGALQGSDAARKNIIKQSTGAGIKKGLLELGSSLRTSQRVKKNKATLTASNPTQQAFNRMGMKLHAGHIKSLYNKSGFNKPTGSQLVSNFNKAKTTAEKMAKNASMMQPRSGQSMIASYSDKMTNTNRLLNTSITKPYVSTAKKTAVKTPKKLTGDVTAVSTKAADMDAFNATMRKIHKLKGIKVNKKNRIAYKGF